MEMTMPMEQVNGLKNKKTRKTATLKLAIY